MSLSHLLANRYVYHIQVNGSWLFMESGIGSIPSLFENVGQQGVDLEGDEARFVSKMIGPPSSVACLFHLSNFLY